METIYIIYFEKSRKTERLTYYYRYVGSYPRGHVAISQIAHIFTNTLIMLIIDKFNLDIIILEYLNDGITYLQEMTSKTNQQGTKS